MAQHRHPPSSPWPQPSGAPRPSVSPSVSVSARGLRRAPSVFTASTRLAHASLTCAAYVRRLRASLTCAAYLRLRRPPGFACLPPARVGLPKLARPVPHRPSATRCRRGVDRFAPGRRAPSTHQQPDRLLRAPRMPGTALETRSSRLTAATVTSPALRRGPPRSRGCLREAVLPGTVTLPASRQRGALPGPTAESALRPSDPARRPGLALPGSRPEEDVASRRRPSPAGPADATEPPIAFRSNRDVERLPSHASVARSRPFRFWSVPDRPCVPVQIEIGPFGRPVPRVGSFRHLTSSLDAGADAMGCSAEDRSEDAIYETGREPESTSYRRSASAASHDLVGASHAVHASHDERALRSVARAVLPSSITPRTAA